MELHRTPRESRLLSPSVRHARARVAAQVGDRVRIVHVVPQVYRGATGPTSALLSMCTQLAARNKVTVITFARTDEARDRWRTLFENAGVQVIWAKDPYRVAGWLSVQSAIRTVRPDIVHLHECWNGLTEAGVREAKRLGIPAFFHPHGGFGAYRRLPLRSAWPYITLNALTRSSPLRSYPTLIATTGIERADAELAGFAPHRISLIPLGVDDQFRTAPAPKQTSASPLRLTFVGNLGYFRPIDPILRAAAADEDCKLIIVGQVQAQSMLARAKRTVDDWHRVKGVEFLGPRYGEDLVKAYAAADFFVYPSLYENFSLPIAEAACMGLPLITSPVGIAPFVIEDGHNGIMVPTLSDADWALALQTAKAKANQFRENARRMQTHMRTTFDWKDIARRIESEYEARLSAGAAR